MQKNLTITEISKLFNISTHTIRFYEKEGLLTSVLRTEGGIRRYDMDSIAELDAITVLKDCGVSLKDIKKLWNNYSDDEYSKMLNRSYDMVCSQINNLNTIKKKLKRSINYREHYTHGQIKIVERNRTFLTPLKVYDDQIIDTPKKLYDFYIDYIEAIKPSNENDLFFTETDDMIYLCKKDKGNKSASLQFNKGLYLSYSFAGQFTYEEIQKSKEEIDKYLTTEKLKISDRPIIILSTTAAAAVGDPNNEIIEILYPIIK